MIIDLGLGFIRFQGVVLDGGLRWKCSVCPVTFNLLCDEHCRGCGAPRPSVVSFILMMAETTPLAYVILNLN